jgi:hypothetical protein
MLRLREQVDGNNRVHRRIIGRQGTAPAQDPASEDD